MAQTDNILQELRELQSSLVNASLQNAYSVPAGYFEALAEQVMQRIRKLEAENAFEEMSPVLDTVSTQMPFTVPAGYFDGLAEQVLNKVKALETKNASGQTDDLSSVLMGISKEMPNAVPAGYFDDLATTMIERVTADIQTPEEELEKLSPLLSGLKKEMPYSIPEGYFQGLDKSVAIQTIKPKAKVVSITKQKWFRYAAAAVVTGFVAVTGFLLINKNGAAQTQDTESIVKGVIKKVGAEEVDRFVQTIDEQSTVIAQVDPKKANEIKELIKDIPEEDIEQFLDETQTGNATEQSEDDIFIN